MPPSSFPHLHLLFKDHGTAKLEGGGSQNPEVKANQANRAKHSSFLRSKFEKFSEKAKELREKREAAGLPKIDRGVPFVLRIPDEDDGTIEFLAEKLKLEIVAEYDGGFLIVASDDLELQHILDLAKDFATKVRGSGGMAQILDIDEDPLSLTRIERILEDRILQRWPFPDDEEMILDVSIEVAAFGFPAKPKITNKATEDEKNRLETAYSADKRNYLVQWEERRLERENEIERFVKHYGGEICSITDESHLVDFPDSFSARIRMKGIGFKDLIQNYANLFEVTLPDEVHYPATGGTTAAEPEPAFQLLPPPHGSPSICVIDSGIQENHRWLKEAVDAEVSKCFVPGKPIDEVGDYVSGGGHGTRVAGACLYPQYVPATGEYQPVFWLLNARVLDEYNQLSSRIFPAELLREIVAFYKRLRQTQIFQHSVASNVSCRLSRMSIWASAIDLLSYREDVLFIQAAGNLNRIGRPTNPGILDHIQQGRSYPDYLFEPGSRLANPAQSLQALTVGSVSHEFFEESDRRSLSRARHPSSFSRPGFGMWNSIKPEVVEFGGEYAIDQGCPPSLTKPPEVCPQLVRSTLHGGPHVSQDSVGTSFSAPKVAHIAGQLAALLPGNSALLYRAIIVNSARWPAWAESVSVNSRPRVCQSIGYGIPELERATENTANRVTLITNSLYSIKAKEGFVFGIPIPQELRRQGDDYKVRVDVTLSYAAEPRRTRKSRRGYLGVWLDWKASKKREEFESFRARALKDTDGGDGNNDGNFRWMLGNKKERDGETDGVSRRNGTVQKDWMIAHSYDLPDIFGIVVRGHEGWDRQNPDATANFALTVTFEALGVNVQIYESIRQAINAEVEIAETEVIT